MNTSEYLSIIENIKSEIKAAQYRAAVHANVDMLLLYHDIGCVINEHKSWGNKFIDNLATDIPGSKRVFGAKSQVYGEICDDLSGSGICADGVCTNSVVS